MSTAIQRSLNTISPGALTLGIRMVTLEECTHLSELITCVSGLKVNFERLTIHYSTIPELPAGHPLCDAPDTLAHWNQATDQVTLAADRVQGYEESDDSREFLIRLAILGQQFRLPLDNFALKMIVTHEIFHSAHYQVQPKPFEEAATHALDPNDRKKRDKAKLSYVHTETVTHFATGEVAARAFRDDRSYIADFRDLYGILVDQSMGEFKKRGEEAFFLECRRSNGTAENAELRYSINSGLELMHHLKYKVFNNDSQRAIQWIIDRPATDLGEIQCWKRYLNRCRG